MKHLLTFSKTMAAWLVLLLIGLFVLPSKVAAQISFRDDFDYPEGNLHGQGGWVRYGSQTVDPIQVVGTALTYPGYYEKADGKSVRLGATKSAEDLHVRFTDNDEGIKEGNVYFSALINVEACPKGNVYSLALEPRTKKSVIAEGISPTELGRVFFAPADNADEVKIGLERGASKPVFAAEPLKLGQTYLVVMRYEINAVDKGMDNVYLYVNPASLKTEPETPSAVIDGVNHTGSGVKSYGLQGLELRQGTNASTTAPVMNVASVRVSDSYAGLFGSQGEDTKPVLKVSKKTMVLGSVYTGDEYSEDIIVTGENLKGDITVESSSPAVTVTPAVLSKDDVMSGDGAKLNVHVVYTEGEQNATLTLKGEGVDDIVINLSWEAYSPNNISTIKQLYSENEEDGLTYRYSGEATVTYVDKGASHPTYYLQDETGGIFLVDEFDVLPADLNVEAGDRITGFIFGLQKSFGTFSAVAYNSNLVKVLSKGNTVEPVEATLAEMKAAPENYIQKVVKVTGVKFKDVAEDAVFAEGMKQPVVTDGNDEAKVRIFKNTTLIGKTIPTDDVELTGAGSNQFGLSVESIAKGTSETDIIVSYTPTTVAKHKAYLSIDCPSLPELSKSIVINAYAIDEQNPPTATFNPTALEQFTAKVDETQEQTLEITTSGLPDFGKIALQSPGAFRVNNTMLMKASKNVVKVTFAPTAAGTYTNALIISALGMEDIVLPIEGVATEGSQTDPETEGDEFVLSTASPVTLLNETFDNVSERNTPLHITAWTNSALTGKRAWWGYTFPEEDESAGECVAKATAYDSKVADGDETPMQTMLVTPALDFKNATSKMFTFRVRGDYLQDNQTDKMELCYIDMEDGEPYVQPIEMNMPCTKDESGEWYEYHLDLRDYDLPDVMFMGFRFTGTRGKLNSATYYIDDVTYGRTDIPVIRTSTSLLAYNAVVDKDAVSDEISVTTENLAEPVKLKLGGPNRSKFKLSTTELGTDGGSFTVSFHSSDEGVHEAYVRLTSRGAADKYVALAVHNTVATGIDAIPSAPARIVVCDLAGRVVADKAEATPAEAVSGLAPGVYVIKMITADSISTYKVQIK